MGKSNGSDLYPDEVNNEIVLYDLSMTWKKICALAVMVIMLGLAFCWPQRLSTWSWQEFQGLELMGLTENLTQLPALPQDSQPWFSELISKVPLRSSQKLGEWEKWAQDRNGKLFFALEDSRSKPTRAVLALMASFEASHPQSKMWKLILSRARSSAPKSSWGEVEETAAALMVVASRLDRSSTLTWLSVINRPNLLEKASAFLQRFPDLSATQLELHAVTPAGLLPRLYQRVEREGQTVMAEALLLSRSQPEGYLVWLGDGRAIRKDWQWTLWQKTSLQLKEWFTWFQQDWGGMIPYFFLILAALMLHGVVLYGKDQASLWFVWGAVWLLMIAILEWQLSPSELSLELQWKAAPSISATDSSSAIPPPQKMTPALDHRTLQLILFFLALQVIVLITSCVSLKGIDKKSDQLSKKLQLLENDEYLYDLGLYIGLGGTVLSLIFLAMGQDQQGMMAAYTSTLFGILEVALFKVFILRPYRQKLIING
jgi:hypothetical protein